MHYGLKEEFRLPARALAIGVASVFAVLLVGAGLGVAAGFAHPDTLFAEETTEEAPAEETISEEEVDETVSEEDEPTDEDVQTSVEEEDVEDESASSDEEDTELFTASFSAKSGSHCRNDLPLTGSVDGDRATLTVPAGSCAVEVSFSSYSHEGTIRPFPAQVLVDNITDTYGPGTHDIGPLERTCNWQTDLYRGPVIAELGAHGHPGNLLIAYDYVEHQECEPPEEKECKLIIEKAVNTTSVSGGDEVEYTITFENTGTGNCTGGGVHVVDVVDSRLTYVSETHSSNVTPGYHSPVYVASNRTLHWNADTLTPGEAGWVKWKAKLATPAECSETVPNKAKITAKELNNFSTWVESNTANVTVSKECTGPDPITVKATKIVCADEADLPNWSGSSVNITATTAADYVAAHPTCHLESGWIFEWAEEGVANPGDNTGAGGTGWNAFPATDASGLAQVSIPSVTGAKLWIREEMKSGYIPFTGVLGGNISAEMYCHTDVLHYDNYDFIAHPTEGETYHCIAFNVAEEPSEESPACTLDADPTVLITPATTSTLTWTTTNAVSAAIDQGVGSITPVPGGSVVVTPTAPSTTYTLTATASDGTTVTCAETITKPEPDAPACSLTASPTSFGVGGGTTELSWTTVNAVSFAIDQGVGAVTPLALGTTSVSVTANATYTGTATASDGTVFTCVAPITVEIAGCTQNCGGGGGGGRSKPKIVLSSAPHDPLAFVYLSQIPYTGLDLGPLGTFAYWGMLILWSGAAAYLVLFGGLPILRRKLSAFGASLHAVMNREEAEGQGPARDFRYVNESAHPAPRPASAPEPEDGAPRGFSPREGFRSYAKGNGLTIDDIVKGLAKEEVTVVPSESVHARVPAFLAASLRGNGDTSNGNGARRENGNGSNGAEDPFVPPRREIAPAHATEVRGFLVALIEKDKEAVFGVVRNIIRGGGDVEAFLTKALHALDEAFRARIEGTSADPDIVRICADCDTPVLERLVTSLATAVDSSYREGLTGAKLALTRALAALE